MPRLIRIVKYFIFATSFFIWEMDEVRSQILDTETVTIKQGVLRGGSKLLNGHRIFTFLGVPYAEAPGVNINNIFLATFTYKIALRSFSLITV